MATSVVEIWNQALIALGGKATIIAEDEDSEERDALSAVYADIRDEVLEETDWTWARQRTQLSLLADIPDRYSQHWAYWYKRPSAALTIRAIVDPSDINPPEPIPFEVYEDQDQGPVIVCDLIDPFVIYTLKVTDVSRFPSGYVSALKFRLAAEVAPSLTSSPGMQRAMMESYARALSQARLRREGRKSKASRGSEAQRHRAG